MRKRRRNLLLAGLVALVLMGALIWLASRPREPVYNGKTLSEWFSAWSAPGTGGQLDVGTQEAIRHIGTNAIPTLLKMLRADDSKFKRLLMRLAEKHPIVRLHFVPATEQNREASMAFSVLGPAASNAVPDLTQIIDEKVSDSSKISAIQSIGWIGPASRVAVPKLLRTVGDTNASEEVRGSAIGTLFYLHCDPALFLPILVSCLNDPDWVIRMNTAMTLRSLGASAKAAVPALVEAMKDPDANVKLAAKQALKAIDPEAAAKAGVQ